MAITKFKSVDAIDALLPQTQCGLCGYPGCRPYAQAIATQNEAINRCPPGGTETLLRLAKLLNQDAAPYLSEMEKIAKPSMLAVIHEDECIGCTKCIQACPVDAIIGAAKQMHTVITDICTGCELCVAPCPTDCIDMQIISNRSDQEQFANQSRQRFNKRNLRLATTQNTKQNINHTFDDTVRENQIAARKNEILAAVLRTKAKKNNCS